MKILYLAAGAAGMYCGSCLHDNTLAAALAAMGEEVLLVPTYTPLRTDEDSVSDSHLFFGGINVYLQQHSPIFRHTPWFLDALLDHPAMIRWLTRGGPRLEAEQLGGLTVSMLQGEHGRQRKEVRKLVHWIRTEAKPDVVHLSNAMLIGVAHEIRKLGIPVLSTLSGEDIFLEKVPPPHYEQARQVLRERAAGIDAFVALNGYYADFMTDYLDVPRSRVHVIPHGLNLEGHGTRPSGAGNPRTDRLPGPGVRRTRACTTWWPRPSDCWTIRRSRRFGSGRPDTWASWTSPIWRRSSSEPTAGSGPECSSMLGELTRAEKIAFLQELDVMSLPTVYRESKGISVWRRWPTPCRSCCPTTALFRNWSSRPAGGCCTPPKIPRPWPMCLSGCWSAPRWPANWEPEAKKAIRRDFTAQEMADADTGTLPAGIVRLSPVVSVRLCRSGIFLAKQGGRCCIAHTGTGTLTDQCAVDSPA